METLGIQTLDVNEECAETQNSSSTATEILALSLQFSPPLADSSSFVDSEGQEEGGFAYSAAYPKGGTASLSQN